MTKLVRIENADNSGHKINVEVWNDTPDGPQKHMTMALPNAADQAQVYIHKGKFLVIREEE